MSSMGHPVDAELSIRGQFVGVPLGSVQDEFKKTTVGNGDNARGDYLRVQQGLNNAPLLPKSEYSVPGMNTVKDPESTKPPRPVQPAPNGHELPVMEEPELPTSTSADVMGPADFEEGPKRSKWEWIQGVFSIGKREDETGLEAAIDVTIAHDASKQDKLDEENIAEMEVAVGPVISRTMAPAPVLSEQQKSKVVEEEHVVGLEARGTGQTMSNVMQKLPSIESVDGKDEKVIPGAWIKSVWGTRQEVDELDLAIQQALEIEQIDSSKYFTRDYTEFASVAHYYVHIHDALDEEEVDLLASFAGRLGEDHPLVQAIVEIMEEDGCEDGSIIMEPERSGLVKSRSPEMGVYISDSGRLKGTADINRAVSHLVPNATTAVRAATQRSIAGTDDTEVTSKTIDMVNDGGSDRGLAYAARPPSSRRMEDEDYDEEDNAERRRLRGKHTMVPGMDDLVNELSALSWLSRKGSMKRKAEAAMARVDEGRTNKLASQVHARAPTPVSGRVPAATQSPAHPPGPIPPAAPTGYPSRPNPVPVPRPKPPPPRVPALHNDQFSVAPEASAIRNETETTGQYQPLHMHPPSEQKRSLLDIICCLKPRVD